MRAAILMSVGLWLAGFWLVTQLIGATDPAGPRPSDAGPTESAPCYSVGANFRWPT